MLVTMHRFYVTAAAYTTQQRISRTVEAWSDLHVLRLVTGELENLGYYVVDVRELRDGKPAELAAAAVIGRGAHPAPARSVFDDML
jgi:hypothetical protein